MIKAIVIGLGFVIVGLTMLLVYGIMDKAGSAGSPTSTAGSSEDFADVAVALPAGARVVSLTVEDNALSLLVEQTDGTQAIMTVDRATGEVLGTLELLPRAE
tara:strand:- start:834 stop:1139 length:306 start_codon:yes stop_codon:yes gene_type:complete